MSSDRQLDAFDKAAERSSTWFAVAMICAALGAAQSRDPRVFAMVGLVGLLSMTARLRRLEPPRRWAPTAVTIARAGATFMVAFSAPLLSDVATALWLYALFCADGLDGFLARRLDAASRLGARVDVESDGFLVMTTCLLLHQRDVGGFILIPGLLRYLYVISTAALTKRGPIPRTRLGRYAFAISFTALTLAFLPLGGLRVWFAALATAVLLYSFGHSFVWSFRARATG